MNDFPYQRLNFLRDNNAPYILPSGCGWFPIKLDGLFSGYKLLLAAATYPDFTEYSSEVVKGHKRLAN